MATENPMRIVDSGGAGNWAPPRGSPAFSSPATARVVTGELGFLLGGRNVVDVDRSNFSPNRSGSAPPNVDGSFASFDNNWGSPLIHDHGTEASVFVPGGYLSTHEEEFEDDRSPQQNMMWRHKSLVDLIQEDFPRTPSPIFSHNLSSSHAEEPLHRDMESLSLESQSSKQPDSTNAKDPSLSPKKKNLTSDAAYFSSDFVSGGSIGSASLQKLSDDQENRNIGFDEQQHTYSQHSSGGYHVPTSHVPGNNSPMFPHAPLYGPNTAYMGTGNSIYPNFNSSGLYPQYGGGYAVAPTYPYLPQYPPQTSGYPPHFNAISNQSVAENLSRFYSQQHGLTVLPSAFPDPSLPYFHQTLQNPYVVPMQYCNLPSPGMISNNVDYPTTSPASGFVPRFPSSPFGSPVLPQSPVGRGGLGREYDFGFSQSSPRNAGHGRWKGKTADNGSNEHRKTSFLEELKASSAGRIDLSEIVGHIAEFSMDQHGSRFIQSTLENCSVEEKELVFKELVPHCSKLITDVFGNYVIQKFFERGTYEQRRDLANQLSGQMLQLSLQMYGCRVIQKALEFVEVEQMTELVLELDGDVMKCVRDQNANHVLQKCIEYLPTEKNYFIFSAFKGQVATLSTHPYGCRVIQRILEHCSNDLCCGSIVDEILEFAYDLAHDQFGNYVIQHILERGRTLERSQIISKLYGSIVRMSHHKYASNVVEKCLGFGDATEQQLLIEEILLQSEDSNDNLLAMMKDQFANYVVQKVLEISEDEQRERLLDRIQPHLVALKKYTYGKHIVARFEQLRGEDLDGC